MIVTGSMMRPIGWALACALLVTTFPKSAIPSGVKSDDGVAAGCQREAARAGVAKLLPISKDTAPPDPDLRRLRKFLRDLLDRRNSVQGTFKIDLSKYIAIILQRISVD